MMRLVITMLALLMAPLAVNGQELARLDVHAESEFDPTRGQRFKIPFDLTRSASAELRILSPDGERVRSLGGPLLLPAGRQVLEWDGRDDGGLLVPDEAYIPVLIVHAEGREEVIDPRGDSGGEVIEDLRVEVTPGGDIAYALPAPARVLVRVGIKGGPMLRSLANWAPRPAGRNVQRWDGRDADGLMDLRGQGSLSVLVTAFRLPRGAIIASGNEAMDYRSYRQAKGWPDPAARTDQPLARATMRISRHYYVSPAKAADPRVSLGLPAELPRDADGVVVLRNGMSLAVKVELAEADRWAMNETLYEVAFFIDHDFVSEEEQGYTPLTWLWTVNGLAPGLHVLTVNISGFSGKVGVASLRFRVVG